MNRGKIHTGVLVLLLLACGVLGFFLLNNKKAHAPTSGFGNVVKTGGKVISVSPLVSEHSTTTYATMDLSYPKSSKIHYSEIFSFVNEARADFVKSSDTSSGTGEKYNITMTTRVVTSSKTVSYIIELYEYTGGAHGGTSVNTFTYDAEGKLVTLDKIFSKPYLPTVAAKARTYLAQKLGQDTQKEMLNVGTEPTAENFSEWYLTDDAIVFVFGQYQVGPYAIGIQEFPLPKSEVLDILSPEFK